MTSIFILEMTILLLRAAASVLTENCEVAHIQGSQTN